MASSIVANRNEINWSSSSHRRNNSFSNTNFVGKFPPFVNPNPNPNPNFNNSNINQYNSSSKKKLSSHQIKTSEIDELKSENTASSSHINERESIVDVSGASFSHSVRYDISTYSKAELCKLKSQFLSELDKVRNLSSRIEAGEINNLTASKKRSYPFPPENGNTDTKRVAANGKKRCVASPQVMKMCSTVLRKVSNQKAGIWFTSPVDAVKMGLHDYHTVIDRPMDLGTIKEKLDKGFYDSPEEFADDVRLTFNNALRYNPKGHEVNTVAGQYLALFEKWFKPILAKFQAEKQVFLQQVAPRKVSPVLPVLKPVKEDVHMVVAKVETESKPVTPPPMPVTRMEIETESKLVIPPPMPVLEPALPLAAVVAEVVERSGGGGGSGRGRKEVKLPKPKAKDVNKREMNVDEKCKLGADLENLPEDKMVQAIQIIRKRDGDVTQCENEIEIDIEAFDTETLWELDRFVTNYKKSESKIRRQSLLEPLSNNNVGHSNDTTSNQDDRMMVELCSIVGKKVDGGGGDVGEEDVDIGDEMPVNNFPPLEIDKDDDKHQGDVSSSSSSSSSSDSDDSSSSDSDSGSSSDSDSDVDDAQSRDNESKSIHR
ncbi:transcription factor GTE2-like [Silene latifolia]|uniref:transcription factor GTE2-like n=1 Tax=Silene latifolia TaxID=37657 RepID=UPI003D7854CB